MEYLTKEELFRLKAKLPILAGEGFILRPFLNNEQERLDLVFHINSSRIWERVSNVPYPYTESDALKWIDFLTFDSASRVDYVIDVKGHLVGSVAFINIDGHKAQLSYWLSQFHQGKGIMTEAVKIVSRFGFETCKFVRLFGYTFSGNLASQKTLERAGFKLEGIHYKEWLKDGVFYDSHMYALVR